MIRNKNSQSKHDNEVRKTALSYKNRGYDVAADILGYKKPPSVGGYRPDVTAKKNGHTTNVEIETTDSVNSSRDLAQQRAFKKAAQSPMKHYVRKVI
jgi:hypothetical protein